MPHRAFRLLWHVLSIEKVPDRPARGKPCVRQADLDPLAADAAVDGTGRIRESLDGQRLTGLGQIFRVVAMYHENHLDGSYEMANLVLAFEPPRVISWKPGYVSPETGKLEFGGWIWPYDLTQLGPDETKVTLPEVRCRALHAARTAR